MHQFSDCTTNSAGRRSSLAHSCALRTALALLIGATSLGCSSEQSEPPAETTEKATSALTVTLPTPVAWWSFDELSSTTTLYDSQPLPAVASGTKSGGVTAIEGRVGRGATLNGTTGYVSIPNKAAYQMTSAMTLSAWAKPTGTTGTIAGKWGTQNSYRILLSSGKYAFSVTLANGTVVTATASTTASTTAWSHVAGVFNGSSAILYINGVQAATANASGSLKASTDPIRIGNTTNNANYYKGSIDELRLYNTALTAAQLNRLANGLQHRRFRAVAIDPKFTTDPIYKGKRLHEHPDLANNENPGERWRAPEAVVQWWLEFLNAAAGERLYLPEDGSYASAVKYTEDVAFNNMSRDVCQLVPGNSPTTYTAEGFIQANAANTLPSDKAGDMFHLLKANNPSLNFDLVNDANGQLFHELAIIVPSGWSIGGEGLMAAGPSDTTAFPTHDGVWRLDGLAANHKFSLHGITFAIQYTNLEQYWHRAEALLSAVWLPDQGNECMNPGITGYGPPLTSLSEVRTVYDLFSLNEQAYSNQAQVGNAHFVPNAPGGYNHTDHERVPSAYSYWASFPEGFPYDLAKASRQPVSCEDWGCSGEMDKNAWIWQLSKLPKAEGMTDGRSNNWWMYVSDPNYQEGRGKKATPPILGSSQGAIDFTLTIHPDRLALKWITETTGQGVYIIETSSDRVTWNHIDTIAGDLASYDISPRPMNAVDTFYRVVWHDGTTRHYSDQLGVNLGSATPVDLAVGQLPPTNPSITLLQGSNPYVRWETPTSCGLGDSAVAQAPCSLQGENGPTVSCVENQCRTLADEGLGELRSDYHQGSVRYVLEKRGSGTDFTSAWTVDRTGGEEYRLRFTSADDAVASNTTVGYRVAAHTADGTTDWGHTDVLLAVPGTATVGVAGGGNAATPCAGICANPVTFSGYFNSGNLGTSLTCYQTTATINGGNCGNFASGRALYINGTAMICNNGNWSSVPAKVNGGYCVTTTAGDYSWAYFATW